jgi:crotonobetainyl-CoA:carnitine CoA-transferase CaiB-like acyl-CoA transferase
MAGTGANNEDQGIFAGLRVIELGSFVAGPAAATILGDLGADVVKVEQPGAGDPWRHQFKRPELPQSELNYAWILTGRNKRSAAIDLKLAAGRDLLHRLIRGADVLVTNLPFRVRADLGIDYEVLAALNARLIYASLTGYGEHGEERDESSFDTTGWWARSGLMDQARAEPQGPPVRAPAAAGDHMSAMSLFGAIVSALYRRETTGKGAYVGSSLMANGAWQNAVYLQAALCGAQFRPVKKRTESSNPMNAHYLCSDARWFSLTINPGQQLRLWSIFAEIMECPQLLTDERFTTYPNRMANHVALVELLDQAFARYPASEWKARFMGRGIVTSIVARSQDVGDDEQMKANDVLVPLQGVNDVTFTVSSPFFIREEAKRPAGRPPEVGEHTQVLLREIGLSDAEIRQLREAKVVQ